MTCSEENSGTMGSCDSICNSFSKGSKEVAKEYKFHESSHDAQCQGKDGYKGLTGVLE